MLVVRDKCMTNECFLVPRIHHSGELRLVIWWTYLERWKDCAVPKEPGKKSRLSFASNALLQGLAVQPGLGDVVPLHRQVHGAPQVLEQEQ